MRFLQNIKKAIMAGDRLFRVVTLILRIQYLNLVDAFPCKKILTQPAIRPIFQKCGHIFVTIALQSTKKYISETFVVD